MDVKTKDDIRQKAIDRLCDEVKKSTGELKSSNHAPQSLTEGDG
jgi:hypothetical protein